VVDDVTVGLTALLHGSQDRLFAQQEHCVYRPPPQDAEEVVDDVLGNLDKVEQGEAERAVVGQ
jgi:hypothetical protein